jgi:hypothetical protein
MRFIFSWSVLLLTVAAFGVILPLLALASEIGGFPIPSAEIAPLLIELATNFKTLGVLGVLVLATLLSVQFIKMFVSDAWKYKRLATLCVAILYSITSGLVVPGSSAVSVIVTVFITSGGAMALYETLKGVGLIKKAA